MPRFRLRLATLGLLIVIIALASALVVQWRRETDLRLQVQKLAIENDFLRAIDARQQRLLQTGLGSSGSSGLPPGDSQDTDRNQPTDDGRSVGPK
jgi:hypothetical protein